MRTIELSNHPARRRERIERGIATEHAAIYARHQSELADHAALLGRLQAERDEARSKRRWLRSIGLAFNIWVTRQQAPRAPYIPQRESDEVEKISAGMLGEQQAAEFFDGALDDDWVLVRGYKNRRGEIDQLLLGPTGLIAIEVKSVNGVVGCVADEWWLDRFDRAGRHREHKPVVDNSGRSPSRQLNEPTDLLAEHLRRHGYTELQIVRVVLLIHPRSGVGEVSDLTVHLLTNRPAILLERCVKGQPRILPESHVRDIANLIVEDHRSHRPRGRHPADRANTR
ncbi:MAG TPA: nuclease-related domain-containing protein [Solirubrobacteraceae bacterium]|nr:nuclease-related domain-containing protein [Solirubrobacteraceae bacterium]